MVIRPKLKQAGIQFQAEPAKTHLNKRLIKGLELLIQQQRQRPRRAANKPKPLFRQTPLHREVERAAEQEFALLISLSGQVTPRAKRRPERAVDVIPTEIPHPHQRCSESAS